MQVEGAKAENGANVQQWGTADGVTHDIWRLIDAGDGYYCIASAVGDGGTYVLDVAGKRRQTVLILTFISIMAAIIRSSC